MRFGQALVLFLPAFFGCGDQSTTGERVVLHTQATTDLTADRTFVTSFGWTVTLESAAVSTGPLYYFDGPPAFTQAPASGIKRFFAALSPIQTAYAHPGHYIAGNAVGEQLAPFSIDLMSTPVALPDGDGITGPFRSATFSIAGPSAGPAVAALDGHVAVARGVATKDGKTVHFFAFADLADIERTAKDGEVTGCVFEESEVKSNGTVTVTVSPRVWFNLVDFSPLAEGTVEAPSTFAADSRERIAFALGLAQLSAYHLAYSTP